ncbi:MAG: hypothetical protein ACW99L_09155, partial [Promethearchaeota archaeon]
PYAPITSAYASRSFLARAGKSSSCLQILSSTQRLHARHGLTIISLSFTNSDSSPLASRTAFTARSVLLFGTGLPDTPKIFRLIFYSILLYFLV